MANQYTTPDINLRFWSKVAITADDNQCWLWLAGKTKDGYGKFSLHGNKEPAHRFAWMFPNYIVPEGMEIMHSCDNPACCNPKHLILGTHQENITDMIAKGRDSKGERHGNSKLSNAQVVEIRNRYATGEISMMALAKEFNIAKSNVSVIVNNKSRKVT